MRRSSLLLVWAAISLSACASVPRAPLSSGKLASIPQIPLARISPEEGYRVFAGSRKGPLTILALSGGGADGAYGAGFLKGWSESGQRPEFDIVTGSSVGALIAPLAFLGPGYDDRLEAIFTSGATDDLMRIAGVNALVGSGAFKAGPMKELISKYADDRLIDAVAARYRRGKVLIVATTNLDTQSTTLWNMGEIASSYSPERYDLFRSVLAASAAIPGIFPPVTIRGHRYMDGGMRSATNADMAKGYDVVFVLALSLSGAAATPMTEAFRKRLDGELDALRASGSRVELVTPDLASLQAFGPNMMDYRRRPAAANAGFTLGRAAAAGLRSSWVG